jgi:hypothetical protein
MTPDTLTTTDELGLLRVNHRPLRPRARSGIIDLPGPRRHLPGGGDGA